MNTRRRSRIRLPPFLSQYIEDITCVYSKIWSARLRISKASSNAVIKIPLPARYLFGLIKKNTPKYRLCNSILTFQQPYPHRKECIFGGDKADIYCLEKQVIS